MKHIHINVLPQENYGFVSFECFHSMMSKIETLTLFLQLSGEKEHCITFFLSESTLSLYGKLM